MPRERYQKPQPPQPKQPQPQVQEDRPAQETRAAHEGQARSLDPPPDDRAGTEGADQETRPPSQPETLRRVLREQQARIVEVLPKRMNADRWISVILAINHRDSYLRFCSAASIYTAAMQGAMLGLDFNPPLGQCYLIPRKNKKGRYEATFMIGYKGLRKLALNSGEFKWIESRLVFQSELDGTFGIFRWGYSSDRDGDDLEYQHIPNPDPATRGKITHAYAVAMAHDGHRIIELMTLEEIHKEARNRSESYISGKSSPWRSHEGMMARKTVLKRLCGQAEMSADLADAIASDNVDYRREGPAPREPRGSAGLAERLGVALDRPGPQVEIVDPLDMFGEPEPDGDDPGVIDGDPAADPDPDESRLRAEGEADGEMARAAASYEPS